MGKAREINNINEISVPRLSVMIINEEEYSPGLSLNVWKKHLNKVTD